MFKLAADCLCKCPKEFVHLILNNQHLINRYESVNSLINTSRLDEQLHTYWIGMLRLV